MKDNKETMKLGSAGLMLFSPEGKEYTYARRFEFETMNKQAHYEALLAALRIACEMEIKNLVIYIDSHLVVNQVKGLFEARHSIIKQYLEKTKEVLKNFDTYSMEHIRRNQNNKADALRKLALMTFEHLTKEVLVEVLTDKSINSKEDKSIIERDLEGSWSKDDPGCHTMSSIIYNSLRAQCHDLLQQSTHMAIFSLGDSKSRTLYMAPGNLKFLDIAVEHSTKFGVPQSITSKDDKQFTEAANLTSKKEESVTKEKAKRKEIKEREVASIEEAH
ncbi:reverse transcriptase domain-containing protein [Tanacetum coccineum]